jgi:hypothetical protein
MKAIRAIILGVMLALATPVMPQQPEPKPVVEYNIASCGSRDFTVIHMVLNAERTTATFGDFLTDATTVKKEDNPVVFSYKEEPKTKDGIIPFSAATVYEKHNLVINGARLGNRIIGILTVDEKLGHVYYGFIGPESDITVGADDRFQTCQQMDVSDSEAVVDTLMNFLTGGSTGLGGLDKS